jgi:hypothetical protein
MRLDIAATAVKAIFMVSLFFLRQHPSSGSPLAKQKSPAGLIQFRAKVKTHDWMKPSLAPIIGALLSFATATFIPKLLSTYSDR